MKTLIYLILSFLCAGPALAQFTKLTQNTPNGWWRVDDLTFCDTDFQRGWAAASQTGILRTLNGGHTWDTVLSMPQYYFRSVDFMSENIGFAGTLDSLLFHTEDGGDTWTQYPRSMFPAAFAGVCGIDHYNNRSYGVGTWSGSPYLVKTTDWGQTWTSKDLSAQADGLVDVTCLSETELVVTGHRNNQGTAIVLKSTDGGETFTEVYQTSSTATFISTGWKIFQIDETDLLYVSLEFSVLDTIAILKSTDGGDTWTRHEVGNALGNIQGIGFLDANHGFVGGGIPGYYETFDGGNTWTHVTNTAAQRLNRFYKNHLGSLYAAGRDIYFWGDTAAMSIAEPDFAEPSPEHSLEVSPNPFTGKVDIRVHLVGHSMFNIILSDAQGRFIKYVTRSNADAGDYTFTEDLSSLAKGSYYVTMLTNTNAAQKVIIKVN